MGRRRRLSKRGRRIAIGCAALALIGGGAAAIVTKVQHDHRVATAKAAEDRAERARIAAEVKADREARERRRAREEQDNLERSLRRLSVVDMRKSITKDARSRVDEGLLDGPIYGTQCDPVGGGSVGNLDAKTTKFECLAINEKLSGGMVKGYRFSATMNWDEGSYTWRLGD